MTHFGKDMRETLASLRAAMVAEGSNVGTTEAVGLMVATLQGEGVENLGFLEAYARKGKPGIAALKAETEAKIAQVEARAAMSDAEAKEAAEAEAQQAAEAAADQTPRAKAAKFAAAVLAGMAKHGPMLEMTELHALAAAVSEVMAARLSVAADKQAADLAAEATKRAA